MPQRGNYLCTCGHEPFETHMKLKRHMLYWNKKEPGKHAQVEQPTEPAAQVVPDTVPLVVVIPVDNDHGGIIGEINLEQREYNEAIEAFEAYKLTDDYKLSQVPGAGLIAALEDLEAHIVTRVATMPPASEAVAPTSLQEPGPDSTKRKIPPGVFLIAGFLCLVALVVVLITQF